MKLNIQTHHTITTNDLELFCDPPLTFEAVGRIADQTHNALLEWAKNDYPEEKTLEFLPHLFVSVSQNGETYPLNNDGAAREFREAVGLTFVQDLIEAFWNYEFYYFKKKRLASINSSTASADTNKSTV